MQILVPLNPIKAMGFDGAIFCSQCFPATGISGAVTMLSSVQDQVRRSFYALMSFCIFPVPMAKWILERLAVESALKVLPLRCQALLGVK